MNEGFFERPILNSPYTFPAQHWELDVDGRPINRIKERRQSWCLITPAQSLQGRHWRAPNRKTVPDSGGLLGRESK